MAAFATVYWHSSFHLGCLHLEWIKDCFISEVKHLYIPKRKTCEYIFYKGRVKSSVLVMRNLQMRHCRYWYKIKRLTLSSVEKDLEQLELSLLVEMQHGKTSDYLLGIYNKVISYPLLTFSPLLTLNYLTEINSNILKTLVQSSCIYKNLQTKNSTSPHQQKNE